MRRGVLAVVSVLVLAGCSEAVVGQPVAAGVADSAASSTTSTSTTSTRPSTTSPSTTSRSTTSSTSPSTTSEPPAGPVATAADLPALVTVVEIVFDAIAAGDFRGACASFELGEDPPSPATLDLCGTALQAGIQSGAGELSPEDQTAALATLSSITVDTALVQLDGPNAVVPDAAIISSLLPERSFYGSDLYLVLTRTGWKVDPAAFE